MEFKIDALGDDNTFLELKNVETLVEVGVGRVGNLQMTTYFSLDRKQALALAAALQAFAATLE